MKVGIIGAGGIAQMSHIPAFKKNIQTEVCAIADINEEKLRYVADKFDIPKIFTDWNRLTDEDLDIISICSPNFFHAEQSVKSLEKGKNVLCEKPVCLKSRDVDDIYSAAERAGKNFMAVFPRRFTGEGQVLKKMIDNGDFGDIYYMKGSWLRRRGVPGLGTWFTDKKLAGGGPMMDIGVHVLDLLIYLSGAPMPQIVLASTYDKLQKDAIEGGWPPAATRVGEKPSGKIDVEDIAAAFIKLSNGASMFIEAGWAGNCDTGLKFGIMGTKAGAQMPDGSDGKGPLRIFSEQAGILTDIIPKLPPPRDPVDIFIDSINEESGPVTTKKEILSTVRIIEAVYESAETGAPVICK